MKQMELLPDSNSKYNSRKEHGGTLALGKRRKQRPLSLKTPLHLVLRSDFAFGRRSLVRHRPLVVKIITKAKQRFHIRVYENAVVANHIHLVVKGRTRKNLQNFFRVVTGHIAQELLRQFPISAYDRAKAGGTPGSREKENKFWQTRIYSRIVSWGREYLNVKNYVIQNELEALGIIPYKERSRKGIIFSKNTS
jgi:REP element-mobilizing transposase RayT